MHFRQVCHSMFAFQTFSQIIKVYFITKLTNGTFYLSAFGAKQTRIATLQADLHFKRVNWSVICTFAYCLELYYQRKIVV